MDTMKSDFLAVLALLILIVIAFLCAFRAAADDMPRLDVPDSKEIMLCYSEKTLLIIPGIRCKIVKTSDLILFADEVGKDPEPETKPTPEAKQTIPTPAE